MVDLQTSMQSDLLRRRVGVRAAYEVLKETDRYSNISHAGLRSGHTSRLCMLISTHNLNIHLSIQISPPELKKCLGMQLSPLDLNVYLRMQIFPPDLNIHLSMLFSPLDLICRSQHCLSMLISSLSHN